MYIKPLPQIALTAFATTASARIIGFSAPAQIIPGECFNTTILTENYIQSVQDISIVFGIAPKLYASSGLGTTLLNQKTLGPDLSNTLQNITANINLPSDFAMGEAVLVGSLFSLFGSRYSPSIGLYNVTVNVVQTKNSTAVVGSVGSRNIY